MRKKISLIRVIYIVIMVFVIFLAVVIGIVVNKRKSESLSTEETTFLNVASFAETEEVQSRFEKYLQENIQKDICSLEAIEDAEVSIRYDEEAGKYTAIVDIILKEDRSLSEADREEIIKCLLSAEKELEKEDISISIH